MVTICRYTRDPGTVRSIIVLKFSLLTIAFILNRLFRADEKIDEKIAENPENRNLKFPSSAKKKESRFATSQVKTKMCCLIIPISHKYRPKA